MYVLYSCDEWCSWSSARVIGIYSSIKTLRQRIDIEVARDNMELEVTDENDPLGFILTYGMYEKYDVDDMEN